MAAEDLPLDLWVQVASSSVLGASDLLSLGQVNRCGRDATRSSHAWKLLLTRDLQPMIKAFWDGVVPDPDGGVSWRQHYFRMRAGWKQQAQQHTGRLLVRIGVQQPSGRGRYETVSLFSLWKELRAPRASTFSVYDITAFSEHHPGIDLNEAAELDDATELWEMNGHSDAALHLLQTFVVPGLVSLPYDRELESRCGTRVQLFFWLEQSVLGVLWAWIILVTRVCVYCRRTIFELCQRRQPQPATSTASVCDVGE